MMATDDGNDGQRFRSGRNLTTGSSNATPMRVLGYTIGGVAVVSTIAGLAVLFSKPDAPETGKIGVGVSPAGVAVSGRFP
jgi:hypothetical protein